MIEIHLALLFFFLGFLFEYIDSGFGGGYGTCLTPIFLLMGFAPLQIIPMILVSETITGFWGGFNHYKYGNIDPKTAIVVATLAVAGSIVGAFVVISVDGKLIKTYIGFLVIAMGILTVFKRLIKFEIAPKLGRIGSVGLLCGFNKLLTGGGFGPVSTMGQHLLGIDVKKSIGSTTLAEGIMSLAGLLLYATFLDNIQWQLAVPLFAGAVLSCVPSAFTTHKLPKKKAPVIIGCFMMILGIATLLKTYLF